MKPETRGRLERTAREYAGSAGFWEDVRADLERTPPHHPTTAAIHKALLSGKPVPEWAADYICDRIDRRVKLPPYHKHSAAGLSVPEAMQYTNIAGLEELSMMGRRMRYIFAVRDVWRWKRVFESPRHAREYRRRTGRALPACDTYREALGRVSKDWGIPVGTLNRYCYPPKPTA